MTKVEFYNENCFETIKKLNNNGTKVDIVLT